MKRKLITLFLGMSFSVVFLCYGIPANAQTFDTLVGCWNFDNIQGGTVANSCLCDGNDGIIYGGPTEVDGRSGLALQFTGTYTAGAYIDIPTDIKLGKYFSIEVSLLTSNSSGTGKTLISKGKDSSPYPQVGLTYDFDSWGYGDRVRFIVQENGTKTIALFSPTTTNIADGNWHKIVGVRDDDWFGLYIDDALIASATDNTIGTQYDSYNDLEIGRWQGGGSGNPRGYAHGIIDDIKIYQP